MQTSNLPLFFSVRLLKWETDQFVIQKEPFSMNFAICDPDRAFARSLARMLQTYCRAYAAEASIFYFPTIDALLQTRHLFHFVLLAHCPDRFAASCSAANLLQRRQPKLPPELIFLLSTADDAHLCFETWAAGYLLKPILYPHLEQLLNRCMPHVQAYTRSIEICSNRITVKVPVLSIQYAEVQKNLTTLHLKQRTYQTYLPLDMLARRLPKPDFLRCHRSYLVHLRYVKTIEGNNFLLQDGSLVPFRAREKTALRQLYQNYCFQQAQKDLWQTKAFQTAR